MGTVCTSVSSRRKRGQSRSAVVSPARRKSTASALRATSSFTLACRNRMPASTFASRALRFYKSLRRPSVPRGVGVMNPYTDPKVLAVVRLFLKRYFDDNGERLLVIGINPGRFGAGITGVTFTDPVALADDCGIANEMPRRRE